MALTCSRVLAAVLATLQYARAEDAALRGAAQAARALAEQAASQAFAKHGGNPCDDEADGWQCHDDAVTLCQGGRTVNYTFCEVYQDCKEGVRGLGSASCEEDACEDKADGFHCHDDYVVECRGRKTVNFSACAFYQECKSDWSHEVSASCQEDVCDDKPDGFYCKDDHVVECRNLLTVSATACGLGQECHDQDWPTPTAACRAD